MITEPHLKLNIVLILNVAFLQLFTLVKPAVSLEAESSFNLNITHTESTRLYNDVAVNTRVSSVTAYRSERLSEFLAGSIIIGYQEQVQDDNLIPAARYAVGYFAGVNFNYDLFRTSNNRLNIMTQYQYHILRGDDADQKITVNWYDISVGIGNFYRLTERLQLLADVSYTELLGNERALEPLSQTIEFKNETNVSYGVGVAYHINANGYVAIKWLDGAQQGFRFFLATNLSW
ncbi:hypothetical protein MNBD_GAMMA22-2630 [hydrothermal vent metagenome]|uniref:Outer membrane protein beta-barrel domain-containing protein n=1 Tax=hydrothermal vent metagenome TaxID=652676 RepID=A0A3B0ZUU2_9ZZZZ